MLNSLDLLVIVSMLMVAASLLSLCLMFLVRRPMLQRICFYVVSALGVYAASVGIRIGFRLFPIQFIIGIVVGAASIGAVVLERLSKDHEQKYKIARVMAAAALIVGTINAFM